MKRHANGYFGNINLSTPYICEDCLTDDLRRMPTGAATHQGVLSKKREKDMEDLLLG